MARALRINIQVDRLPDVNAAGKELCQLGLRLSAAILPDAAEPTVESDKTLVLPWLWRAKRGDPDGTWRVHDKANWILWRLKDDGSNPEKIDEANWELAVGDPRKFDLEVENTDLETKVQFPKVRQFHFRVLNEIDDMVTNVGVRSLEVPGADGVVSGRTVFGLVESLTGLPHPVPAGMQVWTAISLDKEKFPVAETDCFLAAPAFVTPADVAYAVDMANFAGAPGKDTPWQIPYKSDPAAKPPAVTGSAQPSLPMTMLQIASDDTQRLIDLSALLVREGDGPAFEGTDWNSMLPARIAETIDPPARAMAVLDTVIRRLVEKDASSGSTATRDALRDDILPIVHNGGVDPAADYLRDALAALSEPVLAPRARNSRPTAAPAAALLERIALSNSALWPTVVPLLFAQAGAEDDATLPPTPPHFVVSHARIADAAGIVPSRTDDLADDPAKTIDSEQTFRSWILRHWATAPSNALTDTSGNYLIRATTKRFLLKGDTVQPAEVKATGVVDFSHISGESDIRIVIPLKLAKVAALPAIVTFTLGVPGAPATVPSVVFKLSLETGKTELSIDGADPNVKDQTFTEGRVSIAIKIPKETAPRLLTIELEYKDAAGWSLALSRLRNNIDPIDRTEALRAGWLGLFLTSTQKIQAAIDASVVSSESLQGVAGGPGQGQALRSALSVAHAGPAIAGLMGGWVPIEGKTADPALAKKFSLRDRLINTIGKYVPETFDKAFAEAAVAPLRDVDATKKIAEDVLARTTTPQAQQEVDRLTRKLYQVTSTSAGLATLWQAIRDDAKADALRLVNELVPLVDSRKADHVTQDALPLTFTVDQLQDFDESVDLWTRLAGLGVLIGRKGGPDDDPNEWWSLNAATLHVSRVDKKTHERKPLDKDNSVPVIGPAHWPTDFAKSARVDPVPLVVSEINGVRSAVISYQSQSIVAEMQKRPQLDPRGQARAVVRRPEAYLFPVVDDFPKLPPLTFGRTYDVVPYLIGHGGVMPPALRSKIAEPTSSFPSNGKPSGSVKIPRDSIITPDAHAVIRSKTHLRTVPIGSPRLTSAWPGLFEGVAPLAAELPIRPAPITLHQKLPAQFFLDKEQTRGTLNGPPDVLDDLGKVVEPSGIRIEVGSIDLKTPAGKLVLTAEAVDPAAGRSELLRLEAKISELASVFGFDVADLRIDVVGDKAEVTVLKSRTHLFAEDEPETKCVTLTRPPTVVKPVSKWRSFGLVLQSETADFDVEPPSIRWGALRLNFEADVIGTPPLTFQLDGDRPIFPPDFVSQNRNIALLDGIGRATRRVGPISAAIRISRPATTLATYDRWINGPLSNYGNANKKAISAALNAAASRATGKMEKGNDRSLDDPAVEAVVLEIVRLFPRRSVDQAPVVLNTLAGLDAILGNGSDVSEFKIKLDEARGPENGVAKYVSDANGKRVEMARGCIYELRIYGAAPPAQPLFAPDAAPKKVTTRDRFAPAATAGWRDVEIDGKRWHLGAPLILTVEVACEIMPEFYVEQPPSGGTAPLVPFSMNLLRPPKAMRERAAVRLEPDVMSLPSAPVLKYAALRYLDRVALLEQRWSWRGWPHPEVPVNGINEFGDDRKIDKEAANFVDMAFIGRSDDDIGTIHEMRITRAHAYGGRPWFDSLPAGRAPVVLERELDYRGGANLWRFALRAKSRYAAMRPNDPLLIRFSHRRSDLPKTQWWPFIVPDRANPGSNGRKPARPGLMLVVPLTEPLMTAGSVPPLLALFNEAMFPLFHAGDGIESVVEVARHPFIGAERIRGAMKDDFTARWDEVVSARRDVGDARAVLDGLRTIDADPTTKKLADAQTALNTAQNRAKTAEDAYAKTHAIAVAWGFVDHLGDVVKQVTTTQKKKQELLDDENKKPINEQDQAKIKALVLETERLNARLTQLASEIVEATKAATNVEESPSLAGDALRTGSPFVKYWPEFAPDPIRTGEGATGQPLALRCDGPVGYTFDLETEAGRFDHAGILISPVAEKVRPWSLVNLRFRRLEAPELLVGSDGKPIVQEVTLPTAVDTFEQFRLSSTLPDPPDFPQTVHEGLTIDQDELKPHEPVSLRLSFDHPEQKMEDGETVFADFVLVTAKIDAAVALRPRLIVTASTKLGATEQWTASFEAGSKVQLRVVVSQRPKPDGDQKYRPIGDVSVRVRILPDTATDALQRSNENAWLSVICMPLNARDTIEHTDRVLLRVRGEGAPSTVAVRPVRLSDFTPAVWCQFAAAMSRVTVDAEIKTAAGSRAILEAIPVTRLTAKKASAGKTLSLGIGELRSGETVSKIALTAEGPPDADAQVEERLYAVVTRYVYDAFDRLRERPIAVHKLPDSQGTPVLGDPTWPQGALGTPYAEGSGRVRILRVLRGRKRDDHGQGFEPVLKDFPDGFFGSEVESRTTDEPFDAAGQVIGISPPFEWSAD